MNCGLTDAGATSCWGNNQAGQLGAPLGRNLSDPVPVPGSIRFVHIAVGRFYGCGLDTNGQAYCWGIDWPGFNNLGAGTTDDCSGFPCNLAPTPVVGGLAFTSLSVGQVHACGITPPGDAYCWGATVAGVGPVLVQAGVRFASISAGETNTCGLSTTGAAYCWGYNSEGQIGNGIITGNSELVGPTAVVGNLVFASIHVGGAHLCARPPAGKAYCWGRNIDGQLGNGTTETIPRPVPVARNLAFAQLEVRRGHSCGRTAGGSVYCWGQNFFGQLGIGAVRPGAFASSPSGVGGAP